MARGDQARGDRKILVPVPLAGSQICRVIAPSSSSVRAASGLDAALPQAAASAPMLIGGIEGESHVGQRDGRQGQAPQRRQPVEAAGSAGTRPPSSARPRAPSSWASPVPNSASSGGGQIGEGHAGDGAGEQERRIAELGIGRARDHPADVLDIADRGGCCATRSVRPSQIGPWRFRALPSAQSSISAARIASMPPAPASASRPHQHAAAGRRRGRAVAAGRPRRTDRASGRRRRRPGSGAFGEALAAQLGHQRGQHVAPRLRPCHQPGQRVRAHRRYRRR